VHHANLFDRVERKTGIVPFGRLVDEVMNTEPYRSARRVFWIVEAQPRAWLIHLPVHAAWLNQIELYFSIVQRKALTPNDFPDLEALTRATDSVRPALPHDRSPVRVDLHSPRPQPGAGEDRRPRAPPATRGLTTQTYGRLY